MAKIWSMGIKSGYLSVKGSINLWQALVRSILEYGSEIWGFDKWLDGEQVQVDMAKRIHNVKLCMEILDGGHYKGRDYKKLKYWFHLLTLEDSRLLKKVYSVTQRTKNPSSWAVSVSGI